MSKAIVIVGGGGHGRETAEILRHSHAAGLGPPVAGFIDSTLAPGTVVDDLPVLGDLEWLGARAAQYSAIVAVGTPRICSELSRQLRDDGVEIGKAVSPLARISPSARIDEGVIVFPNVVVNTRAVIEAHVTMNVAVTVSHDSVVGRFTNLNPGAHVAGNVTIGEGCYVGMGANVIQNVTIGAWTTIGAGAAVISEIPAGVLAVGVPARVVVRP
jgi:sugar O-acyltransferase (sialic acid O-acetyltransferase NeuD family)